MKCCVTFTTIFSTNSDDWYFDNEYSRHMTGNSLLFTDLIECRKKSSDLHSGVKGNVIEKGNIDLPGAPKLKNVRLVEGLSANLISISQLQNQGYSVKFSKEKCEVVDEFENQYFTDFFQSEGIFHEFSTPMTPQQNGVVKRKNRTLQEIARVFIHAKSLTIHFLVEAANTACHIHNYPSGAAVNNVEKAKLLAPSKHVKKNHLVSNVIGEINKGIVTRKKIKPDYANMIANNKIDEKDNVTRNKARLVAQRCSQIEGVTFGETSASVARLESIQLLLSLACFHQITLYQMDVKRAFLNGFIKEEVYVAQPKGFEDPIYLDYVYKLKKALYDLKQLLLSALFPSLSRKVQESRGFLLVTLYGDSSDFKSSVTHYPRCPLFRIMIVQFQNKMDIRLASFSPSKYGRGRVSLLKALSRRPSISPSISRLPSSSPDQNAGASGVPPSSNANQNISTSNIPLPAPVHHRFCPPS
ncbi:Retrovirus-related Pol polyprotein from transposon TNT 1-94 [Cucumis melo var. makuwa]|uniref:Retrovirus-related Pol polyprotein from transposon TNT 1-94 n=1 Tax=Cucumis melo var. makuwa TaxID=1194695 RepID=A0A5A7TNJ8_CUCMM|nr:Retrovirus-related Pol polyprotein from transposon TNT 1-94 [Cucumis melo var. makuwa]